MEELRIYEGLICEGSSKYQATEAFTLEPVRSSLRLLNASAYRLQSECRKTVPPEPGAPVDFQLLTQQVIQCAYDIAKAAKQLVTITTREKKQ